MNQTFHHRVVKLRPDLLDSLIAAIGPGPVREQGYRNLPLRVDP
jgi:hypothetical protein